ncbi:MAG TPA: ABC transporter permease [Bryobacteraceae bacterium]|nr:ABC transporter permease [Bryobacteraceae bacterium]
MSRKWRYLIPHFRLTEEREMQEELAALTEIAGRRELGNLTVAAENARAVWGWAWLESVLADIRYAIRTLRRQPSFTFVAVVSLALGIGANAAIFSLMDALLWRDLPVRDPESLVKFGRSSRSYLAYTRFAEHADSVMDSVIASSGAITRHLDNGAGPERGQVEFASGNLFESLGVRADIGRAIIPDDDRRANPALVAVLGYDYWRKAYGGRPVLGQSIRIEKTPFTIVGVAPPEFFGISVDDPPDVWLPVSTVGYVFPGLSWLDGKNNNFLMIVGRLRPGISPQQASAVLTPVSIQIDIERNGPPVNEKDRRKLFESKLKLESAAKGNSFLRNRFSKPLRVVFWMVAIGLLLACVNVMSLESARADERRRELTVRLAIGAGRWRIARQLLTESMVVALASGLIGVAMRKPLAEALVASIAGGGGQAARLNLELHSGVLLFIAGVSVAAALVSGVLPAMRATRGDVLPGLQHGSRAATAAPLRRVLGRTVAAAQMALSLVLVASACLFAYSLHQLREFDAGVNRDRLLVVEVNPEDSGYKEAAAVSLNTRLRERIAAAPGVEAVSFSQNGIYSWRNYSTSFEADGFSNSDPHNHYGFYDHVGPYFFTTVGAHLLAGRDFTERDDAGAPNVAIVTREFARRVFEAREAVGRNLYLATGKGTTITYQVVGVVQDIRKDVRQPEPMFYLCQLQTQSQAFSTRLLVRTRLAEAAVIPSLRAAVQMEDATLRVEQIDSVWDLFERTLVTDRLMAVLAWGFGVLAIVLAAVGVYGLLSYEVTRRTGEIGIRMAVGAQKGDVMALVMREVALICGMGLAAGSAAALAMARLVEGLVFQMRSGNPLIEGVAALVLAAVAIGAAWIPARRAARMDPMAALRSE